MNRVYLNLSVLSLIIVLSSCSQKKQHHPPIKRQTILIKADFKDLKYWKYDSHIDALNTFKKSCKIIITKDAKKPISKLTHLGGSVSNWLGPCKEALKNKITNSKEAKSFFEKWFTPYKVKDSNNSYLGKFTGYYEIEIAGSRKKCSKNKHPIYLTPPNLHTLKGSSKLSHASINRGHLDKKGLEIAYTDNKARLFFMHIQGSGIIRLKEGGELKLGYAAQNGHSYKAIGPLFKHYCNDKIRSAVDMMDWLHKHPKEGLTLMEENPSYIFFREVKGDSPIGGQGVALTPERSIAIDAKLYPYGTPIWLETTLPKTSHFPPVDYNRLMIAQDTGGAIKGPIRGDVFFGRGNVAEEIAGYMNNQGSYFILFPKSVNVQGTYKIQK